MTLEVELEVVSGGHVAIELEPPGSSASSYFIFMRHAGHSLIWTFLQKIFAAARLPTCQFHGELKKKGLRPNEVSESSLRNLLLMEGYAFGPIWDINTMPVEPDQMGRRTFLFVRDPRESLAETLAESASVSMAEFLRSPAVDDTVSRYRNFIRFCRLRRHAKIVRYEDIAFGWSKLALDLVEVLGLRLSRNSAFAIARSKDVMARSEQVSTFRDRFDQPVRADLEAKLAEAMAYFGYVPEEALPATFFEHQSEFLRAVSDRLSTTSTAAPALALTDPQVREPSDAPAIPEHDKTPPSALLEPMEMEAIFEPDPLLLRRLKPNCSTVMTVLGRRVAMDVDAYGCRPVTGQPATGTKTLGVYGCSFTYGMALPAEETFCSLVQAAFPDWRVENHGVSGFSTLRNLTQLERNSRWDAANYVTFCWIPSHLRRNVGEISWLRSSMRNMRADTPVKLYQRAGLDENGNLVYRSIKLPRWDLMGIDLSDFDPDPYYLDLVCAAIFRRARDVVVEAGGHFFVTILKGHLSSSLEHMLEDARIPVVDASLNGPEYTCLPDDGHPNTLAGQIYAAKMRDYLIRKESE